MLVILGLLIWLTLSVAHTNRERSNALYQDVTVHFDRALQAQDAGTLHSELVQMRDGIRHQDATVGSINSYETLNKLIESSGVAMTYPVGSAENRVNVYDVKVQLEQWKSRDTQGVYLKGLWWDHDDVTAIIGITLVCLVFSCLLTVFVIFIFLVFNGKKMTLYWLTVIGSALGTLKPKRNAAA